MKFYSEKLDKLFDTPEALAEAESAAAEAAKAKAKKAEAKRAEAKAVEDAFKARNAARVEYNQTVSGLRKQYTEDLRALRKTFDEAVLVANKKLSTAEKLYDETLKEFIDKHPEGYHMTLKDGDNITTLHSEPQSFDFTNTFKVFDFVDNFFKI